jgi:hypothetical protein
MHKIDRILILLILLMPNKWIFSQEDCCNLPVDQSALFESRLSGERYLARNTIGTQLFMDTWFKGDVFLVSGEKVIYKDLAYNGYLDMLICKNPGKSGLVCLDKEQVSGFTLKNADRKQSFVFKHLQGNIENEGKSFDGYVCELRVGSIALFAIHRIRSEGKIEKKVNGVIINVEKVIEAHPVYLIGLPDKKLFLLSKISRRSFYNIFPEHKEMMKTLFDQQNVTLKTENDLIGCIQLIESNQFFK